MCLILKLSHCVILPTALHLVIAAQQPSESKSSPPTPKSGEAGHQDDGHRHAPPGAESLTATLGENALQLFEADDFDGATATIADIKAEGAAGAMNEFPLGLKDSLTSIRWNLRPGMLVMLYEDAGGKGERVAMWGSGQWPDMTRWDFNDKASRWAWYDLTSKADNAPLPTGATTPTMTVPENSVQFFVDKNFGNDMKQVAIAAGTQGDMQTLPSGIGDSLTSIRWSLPPGVVVLLHQDASGDKQQVALWGQGEISDLDAWDFNDKASRWCWGSISGSKPTASPDDM